MRYPARLVRAAVGATVGLFSAVSLSAVGLSTLVDLDGSSTTGCTVGAFAGAEFELVTTVDTTVEPPSVTALALNQCAGGVFTPYAGPNPFTQFVPPWPAGADSGLDAVETYLPLGVGTPGTVLRLGFFSGPRAAPVDTLFTTDGTPGGGPILLALSVIATPALDSVGLLALGLALALAGALALRRRTSRAGLAAGVLLVTAGLGVAVAAAPHAPDGLLGDWAGHAALATDVFPPPDAPLNFEIRRAFGTVENGTLHLRVDIDASSVPPPTTRFAGPTSSQPLALSASGDFLVVANPDNDTATFFDVRGDANLRIARVPVQDEPNGVAMMPDGTRAYVANTVSGTVTVIDVDLPNHTVSAPSLHIPVGTEPWALALTPNGTRLYVANARSGTVSVVDTATNTVVSTIFSAGREPRGLAITNDGDADDTDEKVYVTSFLSERLPVLADGADNAREGRVKVISTATNAVVATVAVQPLADTGFKANGDALARVAPGASFTFTTGAYPNQLANVAIHNRFAYLPSTGASPNGPLRFDVNVQSLLSAIDTASDTDAGITVNLNTAIAAQSGSSKLFPTQPWAMAFEHADDVGYVVSAASDVLLKVRVDGTTGLPSPSLDPDDPTRVFEVPTGKNPRGVVVNWNDTRAYVMNYVSRDVTAVDLTPLREQVLAALPAEDLPTPGSPEDVVQIGKELYNSSVGTFDPATAGGLPITGRLSANGWSACSACHPSGLSDNVAWLFPTGPRRTLPQHADFDPVTPHADMRILDWSANRDEQEDFEKTLREVGGGAGLIVEADGVTPAATLDELRPTANGGRNQLKVRGVGAWDALRAYVRTGIRAPISPVSPTDPDVVAGRALFISANCQQCHGGNQWTSARLRYTPPPAAGLVTNGQILGELRNVGTFDNTFFNEVRDNAAAPLGTDGFAPPSLLSAFAFESEQLHNGVALSFDEVLTNVAHRAAGTSGVDTLTNAADRSKIALFLRSIDADTVVIPNP